MEIVSLFRFFRFFSGSGCEVYESGTVKGFMKMGCEGFMKARRERK